MGRITSAWQRGTGQTGGVGAALVAAAFVALLAATGALKSLEYGLYDAATRAANPPALTEIAIIGIDEASVAALGPTPWPRDVYARLIDQLSAAGAKGIVLMPSFAGAQSARGVASIRKIREALARAGDNSPGAMEVARVAAEAELAADTDAALTASMQRAGNVYLVAQFSLAGGAPTPLPPYAHRSIVQASEDFSVPARAAQYPLESIGAAAAGVGHLLARVDGDGRVREIPLLARHDNVTVPSLALLVAARSLHLGHGDVQALSDRSGVRLAGRRIPTDASGTLRPRFHAAPEGASAFPTTSFAQVAAGKVGMAGFKDKIVLVGETSAGATATWWGADGVPALQPPVQLLAHTVSALRQGLWVERVPGSSAVYWSALVVALLFIGVALPRLPRGAGWLVGVGLALLLAMVQWTLLRYAALAVPLLPAALCVLAGTVALAAVGVRSTARVTDSAHETAESDRMMGLALQGQGQLDMAFERLRKVPPSDALLDNLYHLAQDFERKRNFAKAKSVYKHLLQHDRNYKDARTRYKRVRAHLQNASAPTASVPPSSLPPTSGQIHSQGLGTAGIPALGRYQIEKELGKGAMGVVYLGRDPKIGRVVAIKTLALGEEFEGEALVDARARFFREAETAGRLQHPHIVTIFDAGEEHALAYIAMEFLKGADLTQACRPGHLLPVPTVLAIAARVADALDYAHAHNVVHRDIKPANIMFDAASDSVKVTDFGIARITDSSKTRTGLVLGTPSFMSPEQLAGKKVDGRSDLYSLGVTLFQLLTGSLPLRGESMTELMHKIATVKAPDIRQTRPELSPAVARAVALALEKRPEDRYQTGRQFAADLRAAAAAQELRHGGEPVVYDADRDATGLDMADYRQTVIDSTTGRGEASAPTQGAR